MSSDNSPSSAENTLVNEPASLPSYLRSPTVSEAGDFEAILYNQDVPMLSARGQEYQRYQAQLDADEAEEAAAAQTPRSPVIDISTSSSSSPSPPPLIHEANEGVVFPDRETYLTTPVAYMMGLIEGTPNTETFEIPFILPTTPPPLPSITCLPRLWYLVPRLRPQMALRFAQCRGLTLQGLTGSETSIGSHKSPPVITSSPRVLASSALRHEPNLPSPSLNTTLASPTPRPLYSVLVEPRKRQTPSSGMT
ncbi:hypothetical protein HETIRDRAFT_448221 [Heterobasidion irregulare TC 32-1]|uniref:Uncharacterized protein n=1 Tax=Heterobasidion irregulare (strain TC 32-1) TaxID=747525 RepID=W4KQ46_HETIT|nr:uncharacterized protein HETIRDRAFT_448221 [Heterobasidion irregulare TC 32-1]ETW87804.1 hypothetical protein HETIRDRAFT_448221 [Heterobasidion irregulare TC 32-1]